ncbi:hypothetical protein TNCV_1447921 [Trichonephila clavipes]|nr:hypothetical protein TNCV_1447921 [Trichonephila clavipes]
MQRCCKGTGSRCLRLAVVCEKNITGAPVDSSSERGSAAINQMRWAAREGETGEPVSFLPFAVRFGEMAASNEYEQLKNVYYVDESPIRADRGSTLPVFIKINEYVLTYL